MGSGASSEERPEPTGRYLVNGGNLSEKPKNGPRAPQGAGAVARARTVNNDSASVGARRRAAASAAQAALGDEEDLRTLTKNADPTTRKILQLVQDAEVLQGEEKAPEKIALLQQCYPLLQEVPSDRFDHVAMMVYQKEGEVYRKAGELESAKEAYTRAITLAEKRVARGDKDLYMVLKRYVLSMVGMARIWYEHERDVKGFTFVDAAHPRVVAVDPNVADDTASDRSSLSSLASTLSSGGSVFSLNQEILKAMAPRLPRSQTGPSIQRVKMHAPHEIKGTQFTVEDELTLRSKMTRELVASPCELLLLRCCEVVELGLSCQSELLIPPTIELAQIYEDLQLYSRALLLVRKCLGILCNVFDYDHPWVIELMERADRLNALLQEQLRNEAATKIQSTWKMYRAMQDLEEALGHPVRRHVWIPRKYRTTPELSFLDDFLDDMPVADEEEPVDDEVIELPYVPEEDRGPDGHPLHRGDPADPADYARYPEEDDGGGDLIPSEPVEAPVVVYDPVVHDGEVLTQTTTMANARVVGTVQDTETDTHFQPTAYGDIMTVRTTTVTKTVTEDLDDDEEEEDEEEEEGDKKPHCPRCLEEQPPPVCPTCAYEFPPLTCVNCERDLPFPDPVDPRDHDSANQPWPPRSVCSHCEALQPPRQPIPAQCPQCHTSQSSGPLTCPFCAPPPCPRCHGGQPCPVCDGCGYEFPAPRCVHCRMSMPLSAPPVPSDPSQPLPPVECPRCHTAQPFTPPRPPVCPRCNYRQPMEPYVCPLCGYGAEPEDEPENEPPLCPRCHAPQPPPTCRECGCVQPAPECVHCHRTLPPPDPATTVYGRPWPQDPRAPAQLPPRPICSHCGTRQPPAPPIPPRCPQCHAPQPGLQEPAQCPHCHYGAPNDADPRKLPVPPLGDLPQSATRSPRGQQTPRTPVPPRCPSCNLAQPAPKCQSCGYTVPPPRCPHCYVEQPYPPPCDCDDTHANHPPPPYCWNCGVQRPAPRQQMQPDPKRPRVCPKCKGGIPARPPPCPYCGFGKPYNDHSYYPEEDGQTPRQPSSALAPWQPPRPQGTDRGAPVSVPRGSVNGHDPQEPQHRPYPPPAKHTPPSSRGHSHPAAPPPPHHHHHHHHHHSPPSPPSANSDGNGDYPSDGDRAPVMPPRCPQCRLAQPTPLCEACSCELPNPRCPHCQAEQSFPLPGAVEDGNGSLPDCPDCGYKQPPLNSSRRTPLRCPHCKKVARPQAMAPPCPFCGFGEPPAPVPRQQPQPLAPARTTPRAGSASSTPLSGVYAANPPYRPTVYTGAPGKSSPMEDLLAPVGNHSGLLPPVHRPIPSSVPPLGIRLPREDAFGPPYPKATNGGVKPVFRIVRNYTIEKTRLKRKYNVDSGRIDEEQDDAEDLSISTPNDPNYLPGMGPDGPEDVQVQKETKISADGKTKTVTKTTTRRFAAPEDGQGLLALPASTTEVTNLNMMNMYGRTQRM